MMGRAKPVTQSLPLLLLQGKSYHSPALRPRQADPSKRTTGVFAIHGLTATLDDLRALLDEDEDAAGGPAMKILRHVLRRDRKAKTTYITAAFADAAALGRARRRAETSNLNGAPVRTSVVECLPPVYDPLHVSRDSGPGKCVSLDGLPFTTNADHLAKAFAGYALVENRDLRFWKVKAEKGLSAWLVRCSSEEEAQRIVRHTNSSWYLPREFGLRYLIKSEVFY